MRGRSENHAVGTPANAHLQHWQFKKLPAEATPAHLFVVKRNSALNGIIHLFAVSSQRAAPRSDAVRCCDFIVAQSPFEFPAAAAFAVSSSDCSFYGFKIKAAICGRSPREFLCSPLAKVAAVLVG